MVPVTWHPAEFFLGGGNFGIVEWSSQQSNTPFMHDWAILVTRFLKHVRAVVRAWQQERDQTITLPTMGAHEIILSWMLGLERSSWSSSILKRFKYPQGG